MRLYTKTRRGVKFEPQVYRRRSQEFTGVGLQITAESGRSV